MSEIRKCPRCDQPLSAGQLTGLCPRCVLQKTLEAHSAPEATDGEEPDLFAEPTDQALGQRIGRYKLREKIGEGGCGVVYVADQEEPVRRRVALKVIKPGMDTKTVVARFEAERQALAMMDHPNIAKVLDGGATETGRPYFVMELVRGIRITDYCDQARLNTRQRLDLFVKVCQAIQHAHQKGIIHRDIKPSNILVTLHDGVPVPKVIDFGIAKATEGRLTDTTVYTQLHQLVGTPAYMSPEQAEMSGLDIDTRSDIYSLGVLLYELLTSKPPFDGKELMAAGLEAMRRTIREKEPIRPSTRFASLKGEELTTTAKRRSAEVPSLIRQLRGDLDWIVMKCLEKDRTRRYETASGLAEDLRRYLNQEPVTAVAPSVSYQFKKLVRRNKVIVAAAAGVGAALLIGITVATWQAIRARQSAAFANDKAREAGLARNSALDAQVRERAQRERAEDERLAARQNLYAADMLLAQESYEQGDTRRARDLLLKYRPKHGDEDFRGFEWRYLWRRCEQGDALATLRDHQGSITGVAWSPNGLLATASRDGTARVYDVKHNHLAATLSARGPHPLLDSPLGGGLAFSRDGSLLAVSDVEGVLQLWSANPFQKLKVHKFKRSVPHMAFSPDGSWLAVSINGGGIKVWSLKDDRLLESLPGSGYDAHRLTFTPDSHILIAGGRALPIRLWKAPDFADVETLENPHSAYTTGVAVSPDGRVLATASWDTMIKLWDFESRRLLTTLKGHLSHVWDLDISPDGRLLASASADGTVKLWRLDEDMTEPKAAWRTLRGHTRDVEHVRFSPDGKTLASGSQDQTVKLWRVPPFPATDVLSGHQDWVFAVAVSPDVHRLATGGFDGSIRIWEAETLDCRTILSAHRHNIFAVVFSPDGRLLASCDAVWRVNARQNFSTPGTVKIWDTDTGDLLTSLTNFTTGVRTLAISSTASMLATGDNNGQVRLWNIQIFPPTSMVTLDSTNAAPEEGQRPSVTSRLQFSPDGKRLAILRQMGPIEVWNLNPLQLCANFSVTNRFSYAMAFSPDGRYIAEGQKDVNLWEVETGKRILSLSGHKALIMCAAFSPDGNTLATGSVDHSVKLWNLAIRQEVATLKGHEGPVSEVVFSSDGNFLLSGSEDKTARIWRAATFEEAERALSTASQVEE